MKGRPQNVKEAMAAGVPVNDEDWEYDVPSGQRGTAEADDVDASENDWAGAFEGFGPNMPPEDIDRARKCAGLDQNDRDTARRLMIWFGADLIYVAGMGWLTWRGTHWQRDEGELMSRLMAQNVVDCIKLEVYAIEATPAQARLLAAADKARKKAKKEQTAKDVSLIAKADEVITQVSKKRDSRWKFAVSTGNASKTTAMLAQAASQAALDKSRLDADRYAFNTINGTLKFQRVLDMENPDEDGERYIADVSFDPHDRADYMTRRAETSFDPEAKAPAFMDYLERAHPDPDMRRFLQVFYAQAIMIGGNDEQKILFNYGTGGEGKTMLNEVLGDLAGEYRAAVSPDTMTGETAKAGNQASSDIARLFNARFVTVDELPRGTPLRENMLKSLSGGTKQTARFLQKEFFEFVPMFTAALSGNDMPQTSGLDEGLWRRLLIVKWGVKIPEAEKKNFGRFKAELDAERPGILNWLVDGLRLYLVNGLNAYIPASVRAFTSAYRDDRDIPGQFVSACIERVDGATVQGAAMYKGFCDWCEANAIKPWSNRAFGDRMAALNFEKISGRLVQYQNVRLTDVPSRYDPLDLPL